MALSESGPGGISGAIMIYGPAGSRKVVKAKSGGKRSVRKGGKQNLYVRPKGRKASGY